MTDLHELEDFELDELSALAPTDLTRAAPRWPLTREQIITDLVTHPAPHRATSRPRWMPRLAVAAAAAIAVGGGAVLVNHQGRDVVPAAPGVTSNSPAASPTTRPGVRPPSTQGLVVQIPAGEYLVQRYRTSTDGASAVEHVDAYASDGTVHRIAGSERQAADKVPAPALDGAPQETLKLAEWLVGTPPVRASNENRAALSGKVFDLLLDPRVTANVRAPMIDAAEYIGLDVTGDAVATISSPNAGATPSRTVVLTCVANCAEMVNETDPVPQWQLTREVVRTASGTTTTTFDPPVISSTRP